MRLKMVCLAIKLLKCLATYWLVTSELPVSVPASSVNEEGLEQLEDSFRVHNHTWKMKQL